MLDEDFEVEEVEENRRRSNEDMWKVRGIDLSQIARKQAVLN